VEEMVLPFAIGGGIGVRAFTDALHTETMELVQRSYSDSISRITIGAFCYQVVES